MELGLYLDRINDEFIAYFGEDDLPTEEEVLNEIKNLNVLPESIESVYEGLLWDKIKIKLEERYPYKKFFRTEKKLFELDKYGRKIKDIVYLREYIEETDKIYSKIADVLNIVSIYNNEKKEKSSEKEIDSWMTDGDLIEQIYKAISKK